MPPCTSRRLSRAGIRHIGFKDIGLPPFEALDDLARRIRGGGAATYLEVVSLDGTARSAR